MRRFLSYPRCGPIRRATRFAPGRPACPLRASMKCLRHSGGPSLLYCLSKRYTLRIRRVSTDTLRCPMSRRVGAVGLFLRCGARVPLGISSGRFPPLWSNAEVFGLRPRLVTDMIGKICLGASIGGLSHGWNGFELSRAPVSKFLKAGD